MNPPDEKYWEQWKRELINLSPDMIFANRRFQRAILDEWDRMTPEERDKLRRYYEHRKLSTYKPLTYKPECDEAR